MCALGNASSLSVELLVPERFRAGLQRRMSEYGRGKRARVIEARRVNPDAPQERIAQKAGVSRSTVGRIERGRRSALAVG